MKHMKKFLALALVAITILAVAVPAMAVTGLPSGSIAYTIKGDVALRSSPKIASNNIISRIDTGTRVTIITSTSQSIGFYKVRVDGLTSGGYIREDCLGGSQPAPNPEAHPQTLGEAFGIGPFSYNLNYRYEVKNIQLCLQKAGFNPGGIDGKFGTKTQTAVEQYQSARSNLGLIPDGEVGSKTKVALWNEFQHILKVEGFKK